MQSCVMQSISWLGEVVARKCHAHQYHIKKEKGREICRRERRSATRAQRKVIPVIASLHSKKRLN